MAEIIPAINVRTFEEVQGRIRKVEPHVKWCHLDVTDGIFSKHLTWHKASDLPLLQTNLNVEVHLMVSEPEKVIEQWLVRPVKRVIVHLEAMLNTECLTVIEKCRSAGIQVGFAISPETPAERLDPWFGKVDLLQTLAVHPGPSGQQPNWPEILGKVRHIRDRCPRCNIEVDGGVNPHTYKNAIAAGANILVSGAFIFGSENIGLAIEELKK